MSGNDGEDLCDVPQRPASANTSVEPPLPSEETLEQRLQRLETAITRLSEGDRDDQIAERVAELIRPHAAPRALPGPEHSPAESNTIPRAMPIPPAPTASLADFALPPIALPPPLPDSSFRAVMRPLRESLPLASNVFHRVLPPSSILRDLWWDLRTGYRMLRDPYYPMSLACKFVPLFALFYICVWPWFSSWTGLIGTLMSGLVNIVVLYVTFKVIQRELRRYYDFSQRYRR
jgi:hypothetical protein